MSASLYAWLFLSIAFNVALGTHFRGGTVSWELLSSTGNQHELRIIYKLGWRRNWLNTNCDANDVANMNVMGGYPDAEWNAHFQDGSSTQLASIDMICSAFDPAKNWAYGYNEFIATVTTSDIFSVSYTACCWIGSMAFGGGTWILQMFDIDLRPRSDTGIVNHPPVTTMTPVVTLYLGCPSTFIIPWSDDDLDHVTCRYAVGDPECEGVCGNYSPHFTLFENNCTIYYNGGGLENLVPVALMLEDHPPATMAIGERTINPEDRISRIPLQFIADIVNNNGCTVPTFVGETPQEGHVICVDEGETLVVNYDATPSTTSTSIVQFIVTGPVGIQQSSIQDIGNDVYRTQLTWTRPTGHLSDEPLCVVARDGNGVYSVSRCISLTSGCACNPNPCQNGGTCILLTPPTYVCACPPNTAGENCDCL